MLRLAVDQIEAALYQARIQAELKFDRNNPAFHQQIQAELYQMQDQLIDQNALLPQPIKTSLKNYIRALHIIKKHYQAKADKLQLQLKQLPDQIHRSTCLSRMSHWFGNELHRETKKLYAEASKKCAEDIRAELLH